MLRFAANDDDYDDNHDDLTTEIILFLQAKIVPCDEDSGKKNAVESGTCNAVENGNHVTLN